MANYFSHDSNARNSDKLIRLRMKHKAAGYGVYFMILERLREEEGYMSVKDYNMIAFDLREDTSLIKSVVEDFGLFVFTEDGEYFYSESFNARMEKMETTSEKRSNAGKIGAKKRWGKKKASSPDNHDIIAEEDSKTMANATETDSKTMANATKSDSNKIKEIKENIKEISPDGDTKKAPEGLSSPSAHKPVFPYEKIVGMWNTTCTGYHKLTGLSEKRKMKLKNRIEEISKTGEPLPLFQTLFEKMQNSSFMKGDNRRGWKATFDWLISNGENWRKVLEGNYDNEFMNKNGSYYDTGRNKTAECKVSSRKPGECPEKSVRIPTETDYPSTL